MFDKRNLLKGKAFAKYKAEFKQYFADNLENFLQSEEDTRPGASLTQPYLILERGNNASFDRILDCFKMPILSHEDFTKFTQPPNSIGKFMHALLVEVLPIVLDEHGVLNQNIIDAMEESVEGAYKTHVKIRNNDPQELARVFIEAIVVGYGQQMFDQFKGNLDLENAWFNYGGPDLGWIAQNFVTLDGIEQSMQSPIDEQQLSDSLNKFKGEDSPMLDKIDAAEQFLNVGNKLKALKLYIEKINSLLEAEHYKKLTVEQAQLLSSTAENDPIVIKYGPVSKYNQALSTLEKICNTVAGKDTEFTKNLLAIISYYRTNGELVVPDLLRMTEYLNKTIGLFKANEFEEGAFGLYETLAKDPVFSRYLIEAGFADANNDLIVNKYVPMSKYNQAFSTLEKICNTVAGKDTEFTKHLLAIISYYRTNGELVVPDLLRMTEYLNKTIGLFKANEFEEGTFGLYETLEKDPVFSRYLIEARFADEHKSMVEIGKTNEDMKPCFKLLGIIAKIRERDGIPTSDLKRITEYLDTTNGMLIEGNADGGAKYLLEMLNKDPVVGSSKEFIEASYEDAKKSLFQIYATHKAEPSRAELHALLNIISMLHGKGEIPTSDLQRVSIYLDTTAQLLSGHQDPETGKFYEGNFNEGVNFLIKSLTDDPLIGSHPDFLKHLRNKECNEAYNNLNNTCSTHPEAREPGHDLLMTIAELRKKNEIATSDLPKITKYLNDASDLIKHPTKNNFERHQANVENAFGMNRSWGSVIGKALLVISGVFLITAAIAVGTIVPTALPVLIPAAIAGVYAIKKGMSVHNEVKGPIASHMEVLSKNVANAHNLQKDSSTIVSEFRETFRKFHERTYGESEKDYKENKDYKEKDEEGGEGDTIHPS
jgi:hypothetical protein